MSQRTRGRRNKSFFHIRENKLHALHTLVQSQGDPNTFGPLYSVDIPVFSRSQTQRRGHSLYHRYVTTLHPFLIKSFQPITIVVLPRETCHKKLVERHRKQKSRHWQRVLFSVRMRSRRHGNEAEKHSVREGNGNAEDHDVGPLIAGGERI